MNVARSLGVIVVLTTGCSDPTPAPSPAPKETTAPASAPAWKEPPREGCVRSGTLEGIEKDAACLLGKVPDDLRDASRLKLTLNPEPSSVTAGGTARLRVTLRNPTENEILVVLDVQPPSSLSTPDWKRLSGVGEVRADGAGTPRLHFGATTLDAREQNVDGLPMVAPQTDGPPPRAVGVWLKPKAKLIHDVSWWAFRIPTPAPIFKDDAGHRFVPKTAPTPLSPGDYTVNVDVPLRGLSAVERSVSTTIHVLDAKERIDSGAR